MPNVIDLYCGVGGLSLGAARAGFDVAAVVDNDEIAMATHALNFPNSNHLIVDIAKLNGQTLLSQAKLKRGQLDGLIGGPPCQGFSHIGKKNPKDKRNNLFVDFFRLVGASKPKFFLAENVPGILNKKNKNLVSKALKFVEKEYHLFDPLLISANNLGAPTSRTRVFFIGVKKDLLRLSNIDLRINSKDYVNVTIRDALEGLPTRIDPSWTTEDLSWRKVGKISHKSFSKKIFSDIPKNVGNRSAINRFTKKREVSGFIATCHDKEVKKRFSNIRQGCTDPISRAPRLNLDGYCPTLRAGTGKDRGSFQSLRPIHPTANRVITPREAARLQGFPDWFIFHPTKWHSFRQIGNSVSPIVAENILSKIYKGLF